MTQKSDLSRRKFLELATVSSAGMLPALPAMKGLNNLSKEETTKASSSMLDWLILNRLNVDDNPLKINLNRAVPELAVDNHWLVVNAYTDQAEFVKITQVGDGSVDWSSTITIDRPLTNTHRPSDLPHVLLVEGAVIHTIWFGGMTGVAIQNALDAASNLALSNHLGLQVIITPGLYEIENGITWTPGDIQDAKIQPHSESELCWERYIDNNGTSGWQVRPKNDLRIRISGYGAVLKATQDFAPSEAMLTIGMNGNRSRTTIEGIEFHTVTNRAENNSGKNATCLQIGMEDSTCNGDISQQNIIVRDLVIHGSISQTDSRPYIRIMSRTFLCKFEDVKIHGEGYMGVGFELAVDQRDAIEQKAIVSNLHWENCDLVSLNFGIRNQFSGTVSENRAAVGSMISILNCRFEEFRNSAIALINSSLSSVKISNNRFEGVGGDVNESSHTSFYPPILLDGYGLDLIDSNKFYTINSFVISDNYFTRLADEQKAVQLNWCESGLVQGNKFSAFRDSGSTAQAFQIYNSGLITLKNNFYDRARPILETMVFGPPEFFIVNNAFYDQRSIDKNVVTHANWMLLHKSDTVPNTTTEGTILHADRDKFPGLSGPDSAICVYINGGWQPLHS